MLKRVQLQPAAAGDPPFPSALPCSNVPPMKCGTVERSGEQGGRDWSKPIQKSREIDTDGDMETQAWSGTGDVRISTYLTGQAGAAGLHEERQVSTGGVRQ